MKVFSVEKFKEDCISDNETKEQIKCYCRLWANMCDGLTEEEIARRGLAVLDEWMVDKEEK